MDTKDLIPLFSAIVGVIGVITAAFISYSIQKRKLKKEIDAEAKRLVTEFAVEESVEAAVRHFLELTDLPFRSFPMIRHHIGGFESNELRKLLVRSGAVRFMAADGTEMWALRERVKGKFAQGYWKLKDSPLNKTPESDLFPGVFNDTNQY